MSRLYTTQLLGLAAECASWPLDSRLALQVQERSPVCGSTMALGLALDETGQRVHRIGFTLSACAIGQASAAIMAAGIGGVSAEELRAAQAAIRAWLEREGETPDWPRFGALEAARRHHGRHGALLLPWNAAVRALSTPVNAR